MSMTCRFVDTHCHLDLYVDVPNAIRQVANSDVETIAVTNTPSVYSRLVELSVGVDQIHVALGLHPELAHVRHPELPLFRQLISSTRYIGEVGLDYVTADRSMRQVQRAVFTKIVDWSSETGDKILTIHSRRAADDVVDTLGVFHGTYILHWYTGSAKALERALANGAYVSVNPAMCQSQRGQALMARVPVERVLTETDGPFVSVGERPAVPSDVANVVDKLSEVWKVSSVAARELVYANYRRIAFGDGMCVSNRSG